jgi:prefoldin subunit 5
MSERMQSLLSRAAEDQLAEQRQLAGALTDLRAQLQSIAADVGSLRDRSGDGGGSVEGALASVSADVREAVRLLGERLDGLSRLVAQRGNDLAELNAASSALQAAVRGHGEALAGLGNGLDALPSFGERIGGLQNHLSALHERLAGLDELTGTVGVLQQRVESMDHGVRELRSAFAAIGARMAELPGRSDLDAAAARSTAALAGLGERLDRLEEALRGVPEAVAARAPAPAPAQPVDLGPLQHELSRVASAHAETAAGTHERLSALEARTAEVLAALTPEEEEDTDEVEPGDEVEDPVAIELAELREALLGEGGIAERLEAAGEQDLDEKVATAVQRAVSASEERLSAHFDEAVLALAEALLRRRTGRSAAPRPAAVAPDPATVEAVRPDVADEAEPVAEVTDADEHVDDERSASAPWQTPTQATPDAQHESAEDTAHRRRPWWRPGD